MATASRRGRELRWVLSAKEMLRLCSTPVGFWAPIRALASGDLEHPTDTLCSCFFILHCWYLFQWLFLFLPILKKKWNSHCAFLKSRVKNFEVQWSYFCANYEPCSLFLVWQVMLIPSPKHCRPFKAPKWHLGKGNSGVHGLVYLLQWHVTLTTFCKKELLRNDYCCTYPRER